MYTKNINVTSLHHSPEGVDEYAEATGQRRYRDGIIKELLKTTRFTGYLLSLIIGELKGVSLDDFQRYVGGGDMLNLNATELGSAGTKNIRLDLVFEYDGDSGAVLRIDLESQTSQEFYSEGRKESYSLVGRAVYYAALTLATELGTGEGYHLLRKVYSVWFCYERPIPDVREPILRYSMGPELDYQYCTPDGNGDTSIYSCRRKFDDGDLISVIMVSVPDVEEALRSGRTKFVDTYDLEELKGISMLLSDGVDRAKRKEFYRKNGITKGDDDMLSTFEDALKDLEDRMAADNDAEIKKLLAEKDAETRKLLAEKDAEKDAETRKLLAEIAKLRSLLKNK